MSECVKAITHYKDKIDYITLYHNKIKDVLGMRYAYTFAGGRMALYAILQALGIGKDDEVIIQGYTCCVVPKAIMYAGARPVYADITKDYNLSFKSVVANITDKTKAIVVQHTYGIPCHAINRIRKLCDQRKIYMIEDCAHTFGSKWNGRVLGSIGDVAFFSTDHTKYISTSVGGIAVTNNVFIGERLKKVYNNVRELTSKEKKAIVIQFMTMNIFRNKYVSFWVGLNGMTRRIEKYIWWILEKMQLVFYMNDYNNVDFPKYTFPAKLSNIQGMIGISQLEKLNSNIAYRRELTKIYKIKLGSKFYIPNDCDALLRMPLIVKNPKKIIYGLKDIVKVEQWFSPALECIKEEEYEKFGYDKSTCPMAQKVAEHIVNLPVHPKVTPGEVEEICTRILQIKE
ncbi:MAG: DegT/DnrJ/EryC1/StrS family aminotransferase [Lachnospiraceae bacterium]|nr:DegT/DnrJ/EryC1/StrS family aminotransferase [Lachnospiraceae bacterium]